MARPATAAVRLLAGEREPVRLATTANIALSSLLTIDSVATAVGDRILVKDQTDKKQNGIYTASAGAWFRASDARDSRAITEGVTVHVQEGSTNAGRAYRFNTVLPKIGQDLIYVDFYLSASFAADAEAVIDAKKAEINSYVATTVSSGKSDISSHVSTTVNAGKDEINATAQAVIAPLVNQAEDARDIAAGYASDAVSQGNVPIYATVVGMAALTIPVGISAIRVNGRYAVEDGLGGLYTNVNNGSTDTFTTNGGTRTWYRVRDVGRNRLSDEFLDNLTNIDAIPNYDPSASATRLLINGSTENGGSPAYHRHFGTIETDNIGRVHVAYRRALGHATYFNGGIYEVVVEHNGQARSAERQLVAPVAGWDISDPRMLRLPNGNLLLVWQELRIASPGLANQAVFKAKVSRDNGETYSAPWTLFTSGDGYCRLFGQLQLIQGYGAGGRWRIAFTAYLRVFAPTTTLNTAIFYSEDGGLTFTPGTPIYAGATQYNETAVAWANASVGLAVMRVNPSDGFWGSRTLDGGLTWSAPVKMIAFETAAVAPSLNVVTKNGVQYFLLGYCDRTADVTKWRWDSVSRALGSIASAFTTNAKITSATDMIEASGYQATKLFPSGQMLFVEFKEYPYNTTISDPVGADVRLVYASPLSWIGGEEAFTPTIAGATTPGAPIGSFSGTIKRTEDGEVTGTLRIALTSKGGMVGQLKIGGFLYPNKNGTRYRSGGSVNFFSGVTLPNYSQPYAFMASASSTLDLWRSNVVATDTTGLVNLDASQVSDTFTIELTFQYFTDA